MQEMTIYTNGSLAAQKAGFTPDLFSRWISFIDAAPKTAETYTRNLRGFISYLAENGITNPSRENVIAYRDGLKAQGKKPTTIQAYLAPVRLFFTWTAAEGLYPNVAAHIKGAKIDKAHKKDYLTSRQSGNLLGSIDRTTLKGKRDFALLFTMITTGLRTVSIIRANIGDLRPAGDFTALYYQGKGHEEKADFAKIEPEAEDAIREYLNARGEKDPAAPLFASEAHRNAGERMTTRSISRIAKEHMVEIGLDDERHTAHSLRHTAATLALLNGESLEDTQKLLGHASIDTTQIYAHHIDRARSTVERTITAAILPYIKSNTSGNR